MRTQASTNRKRLASSFTRMNSEQLNRSASAPGDFAKTLGQIQHILANDTPFKVPVTSSLRESDHLKSGWEPPTV
ncbi:hypothetical protein KEM48_008119 [Puccinia striiformis f. sp. tritici PST-130]|nr:hypothetical protein KEM48_008119 [Puccinia striiformis f. sp. tritici PST-130]